MYWREQLHLEQFLRPVKVETQFQRQHCYEQRAHKGCQRHSSFAKQPFVAVVYGEQQHEEYQGYGYGEQVREYLVAVHYALVCLQAENVLSFVREHGVLVGLVAVDQADCLVDVEILVKS